MGNKRKAEEKLGGVEEPKEKKEKVESWLKSADPDAQKPEKTKKRPWRNKVRKLAAKKAAAERKAENPEIPDPKIGAESKKRKRGPKKKKFRAEADAESSGKKEEEKSEEANPILEAKKRLDAGRFRFLNEKLYTCSGNEAFEFFKEDPNSFDVYHKGFADQVKKWPNHPLREIIRWLESKPDGLSVFDLGCGEAKIAEAVGEKHKIRSFDLVAVNDRVESCDMSKLPADDSSADVVVFCLSLMGTNLYDFIREARRVLKIGGILKIAEVTSRFVSIKQFCEAIQKMGFEISTPRRQLTDYFMLFEFRKTEKVEQKRPYGLKLKPCLYKKR